VAHEVFLLGFVVVDRRNVHLPAALGREDIGVGDIAGRPSLPVVQECLAGNVGTVVRAVTRVPDRVIVVVAERDVRILLRQAVVTHGVQHLGDEVVHRPLVGVLGAHVGYAGAENDRPVPGERLRHIACCLEHGGRPDRHQ
jgi:hypothetical protein